MKIIFILLFCIGLSLIIPLLAQDNPGAGFISIDCGVSNAYTDSKLLIHYETDAGFIDSGVNMQVSTSYMNQELPKLMNLRSFPDGKRNCYILRPKQVNSNRYLIRAFFYYGNYDGRSQTPRFDLHIDVNYWTTVENTTGAYEEIIYTTSRDYLHVCLVNTGFGVPFISVLELRILDSNIYNTKAGALQTRWRENIGSSTTYRYPEDPYDRIWEGRIYDVKTIITNTTNIDSMKSNNDAYKVPLEVLMTADESYSGYTNTEIHWTSPNASYIWYVFLHIAEIQILQTGQVRRLSVYVNNDTFVTTVMPEYLKPVTVSTLPVSGNFLNFLINTESGSKLPAFFNAVESFVAIDLQNSPTDRNDVDAITDIRSIYGVFGNEWQGDPCIPREFTWRGLICSPDTYPRITSLNMTSSQLKGTIASSFSKLTALESLDLSFNELTGTLPEFLAFLPQLRVLNLSGNNLNGAIPEAFKKKKITDKTFILRLDGNPDLCVADSCSNGDDKDKKRNILPLAVGVASAILVLLMLCVIGRVCMMRRKRQREVTYKNVGAVSDETQVTMEITRSSGNATSFTDASAMSNEGKIEIVNKNRHFTSSELLVITKNFKDVIGEGGFGNVYLGSLQDGNKVAVKVLSSSSRQGYKEFRAEAQLLMIVYHKNLVSLIGYCDEVENMSLVYEFMSNGNIRQHLSEHATNVLAWSTRLQIGIDAAQGLEYLHHGCRPPIVHRDLKTSNILLNDKMQAKIGDFGLSRVFATDTDSYILTRPAGTPGYLDPEFNMSGSLNTKSDVYSFGIILLELITGHPAIIRGVRGSNHIVDWVTPFIKRGDIHSIVDPRMHDAMFDAGSVWKAVEIATQCVQLTAIQRPDITQVLSELKECLAIQTRYMMQQAMEDSQIKGSSLEITSVAISMAPRVR